MSSEIDVKAAVAAAVEAARLFLDGQIESLRLEEVELPGNRDHWVITLGFLVPEDKQPQDHLWMLATRAPPNKVRIYKQFLVDAVSGRVTAMKIRNL